MVLELNGTPKQIAFATRVRDSWASRVTAQIAEIEEMIARDGFEPHERFAIRMRRKTRAMAALGAALAATASAPAILDALGREVMAEAPFSDRTLAQIMMMLGEESEARELDELIAEEFANDIDYLRGIPGPHQLITA